MSSVPHLSRSPRWLLLAVSITVLVLFGASMTAAQDEIQPDLRLNQVTHFGGDAFYCVDGDINPTQQYSDFGDGGFRLLNIGGQELWFVPATPTVHEATQHALETGEYTLVAEGQGTYGPVSLFTFLNGDGDVLFTFNGFDEWGKPNSITFKYCEPVNPIPQPAAHEPGHDCNAFDLIEEIPIHPGAQLQALPPTIPCDECEGIIVHEGDFKLCVEEPK